MQLNNINCEFTDSEIDTENTTSINMINFEIDYEPIIYDQPIYSQIYQNHDHLIIIQDLYPVKNKGKIQKIVEEVKEENPTECSNTNYVYQNIPKETQLQNEKNGQSNFF